MASAQHPVIALIGSIGDIPNTQHVVLLRFHQNVTLFLAFMLLFGAKRTPNNLIFRVKKFFTFYGKLNETIKQCSPG